MHFAIADCVLEVLPVPEAYVSSTENSGLKSQERKGNRYNRQAEQTVFDISEETKHENIFSALRKV